MPSTPPLCPFPAGVGGDTTPHDGGPDRYTPHPGDVCRSFPATAQLSVIVRSIVINMCVLSTFVNFRAHIYIFFASNKLATSAPSASQQIKNEDFVSRIEFVFPCIIVDYSADDYCTVFNSIRGGRTYTLS